MQGDPKNGAYVFQAAGCDSCHMGKDKRLKNWLSGGEDFKTPFDTFYAPKVSMSEKYGIGKWTYSDFYKSLKSGVNPKEKNCYPTFLHTSYSKTKEEDIADLWEFLEYATIGGNTEQIGRYKISIQLPMDIGHMEDFVLG